MISVCRRRNSLETSDTFWKAAAAAIALKQYQKELQHMIYTHNFTIFVNIQAQNPENIILKVFWKENM